MEIYETCKQHVLLHPGERREHVYVFILFSGLGVLGILRRHGRHRVGALGVEVRLKSDLWGDSEGALVNRYGRVYQSAAGVRRILLILWQHEYQVLGSEKGGVLRLRFHGLRWGDGEVILGVFCRSQRLVCSYRVSSVSCDSRRSLRVVFSRRCERQCQHRCVRVKIIVILELSRLRLVVRVCSSLTFSCYPASPRDPRQISDLQFPLFPSVSTAWPEEVEVRSGGVVGNGLGAWMDGNAQSESSLTNPRIREHTPTHEV